MYRTCIFCHRSLGANRNIEEFPVGRRLAFDSAKGRLWVVCRRCGRWNLSPLEERWEAIESCQRQFRASRLRLATPNIGLARVADGLDLVRIGQPLLPELAAWRYGPEFLRRRRTSLVATSGLAVGIGVFSGVTALTIASPLALAIALSPDWLELYRTRRRIVARVVIDAGMAIVRGSHALRARILPCYEEGKTWSLYVGHERGELRLRGAEALRVAGSCLTRVNRKGARKRDVQDAVALLEYSGGAEGLFGRVGRLGLTVPELQETEIEELATVTGSMASLPPAERLALEMATQEENERRAMQGELIELERAWREAEEIAAIADNLL
jgi:hypothetical protein